MAYYKWNNEKNQQLKSERGAGFEQIVIRIESGGLLDVTEHPNQDKYPNQNILIVEMNDYVFLVPFVEEENGVFFKTIIPSRKATRKYLRGKGENVRTKT